MRLSIPDGGERRGLAGIDPWARSTAARWPLRRKNKRWVHVAQANLAVVEAGSHRAASGDDDAPHAGNERGERERPDDRRTADGSNRQGDCGKEEGGKGGAL